MASRALLERGLAGTGLATALLALAGCTTIQTTSGGDYVAARPQWAAAAQGAFAKPGAPRGGVDRAVFEAANAEPLLRFPARIGLARVHQGALTTVPPAEADAWLELVRARGAGYGGFVPVSPLVAQLTAAGMGGDAVRSVVDTIRVGAARQHLDAVLVYEVSAGRRDSATPLSVLHLTIIGGFLVPSRALQGRATAAAMLIDVRNGYPYLSTSAQAEEDGVWTNAGSTERSVELMRRAQAEAVRRLAVEVGKAVERLRADLDRRDLERLRAAAERPARRS